MRSHPDSGKEITVYSLSRHPDRVGSFLFQGYDTAYKFRSEPFIKKYFPDCVHIVQVSARVTDCFEPHREEWEVSDEI